MATQTANYLDAIAHLPAGSTLILADVPWDEYEQLLVELGDGSRVRVSYDRGRLEIMSPSLNHEMYKELLVSVVRMVAEETGLDLESRGSTTFKQKHLAQGAEPDTCFYVHNAARIIGKDRIDLSVDPAPDVVVEIDVSHASTGKFLFYAALGVPEIWRCEEGRAHIYHLTGQGYVGAPASRAFPVLTGDALSRLLEQSKTEGQSATLRSLREWLRSQRSGSA
jgi:Uma2 family endonuclease